MADKRIEILILQDSMEDFELLKMEFEKADVDFRLSHAQTGEAFESILESKLPDVVISDYNIPGYDIFKALDALKGKDYRRPFLLISEALEDEKAVELIIQHGINDYILKDNLKRLIPTVKVEYEKNLADLKLEENNKELAKLSMVASHTHNGVMITNAEGEVEWVNKAFTEITGYSLAETKGIKPGDLLQGKDTDQRTVQRISKKLKKAVPFSEEILNYNKKRDPFWVKLDITPVFNDEGKVEKFIAIQEDVTESKQTKLRLKETEEQLGDIISNLNATILKYALHPDGTSELLYISDNLIDVQGVPAKEAREDVGLLFSMIHAEDIEGVQRSILKSADNLSEWDHTWRFYKPDGSLRYLRGRGIPKKQENETVIWNTINIDETDQFLKEQRKKELENLLQGSLDEIYIFEAETLNFVYNNATALENVGYNEQEIKRLTPLDIKPEYSLEEFSEVLDKTKRNDSYRFETIHKRKDGSEYNVLVNLRFTLYRNKEVFIANILDTTELVKARQNLEKAQTYWEIAVEGSEIGLWEFEPHSYKAYYNDNYYKMLGYKPIDALATKSFYDDLVHPDDADTIEKHLEEIYAQKKDSFEATIRLRHKDGTYRWILDKGKVIGRDSEGNPEILAGSHLDITELVEAVKHKDVLIQEIHHRVKNNLAIVSGLIELQMIRENKLDDEGLMDTKQRIQTIASVHEQLYSNNSLVDINIENYFDTLIKKISLDFIDKEQAINVNFESKVGFININQAVPIGLLVNELLTNSIKHAFPSGKGDINIYLKELIDGRIEFGYEDSGTGFTEEEATSGTGFGLKLIDTLIKQLTDDFYFKTDGQFQLIFNFIIEEKGAHSNII